MRVENGEGLVGEDGRMMKSERVLVEVSYLKSNVGRVG
jgi:hypothetical protein